MSINDRLHALEGKVNEWKSESEEFAQKHSASQDWGRASNFGNVSGGLISSLNSYLELYYLESAENYIFEAELQQKALETYFILLKQYAHFRQAELDTTKGYQIGCFPDLVQEAMKQGKIRLYVEESKKRLNKFTQKS